MAKYSIVIDRSGYKTAHIPINVKNMDAVRKKVLKDYAGDLKYGSTFIDVYTGVKGAYSRSGVLHRTYNYGIQYETRNGVYTVDPKTGKLKG